MKRVSFKVAKAIKSAGYPQEKKYGTALYPVNGEFKGKLCGYNSDAPERDKLSIVAPTYIEVWGWLWREKNCYIQPELCFKSNNESSFVCIDKINHIALVKSLSEDPEEAIIAAIEYLVENNLLK